MRRFISVFLVLVLMMAMAIPCLAASPDDVGVTPYTISSDTAYDTVGNSYRLTGSTTISGYGVIVVTRFKVLTTNAGLDSNLDGVTQYLSHDVSVYFSDGTTPDYDSIDDQSSYNAQKRGDAFNLEGAQTSYNALPSSVFTGHKFYTNKGGDIAVNSGDTVVN